MAAEWFEFDGFIAATSATDRAAPGATFAAFAVEDEARATPLSISDLTGTLFTGSLLVASDEAYVGPHKILHTSARVVLVSPPPPAATEWAFVRSSVKGIEATANAAHTRSNEAAASAASAAEQATLSYEQLQAYIAANPSTGDGGTTFDGTVLVSQITDRGTTGEALLRADTPADARAAGGMGVSDVTVAGALTGDAAPAGETVNITGDQVIDGEKTFRMPPRVPVGAFPQSATLDLERRLKAIEDKLSAVGTGSGDALRVETLGTVGYDAAVGVGAPRPAGYTHVLWIGFPSVPTNFVDGVDMDGRFV